MNQNIQFDLNQVVTAVADAGLFDFAVMTIMEPSNPGGDPPVDDAGVPDLVDYTPRAGYIAIDCMLGVFRMRPDVAAVARTADRFDTLNEREVIIDGYYPLIQQYDVADITVLTSPPLTTRWEIMSVESDSQGTFTRLAVRTFTR